jgi:alkanesulfonate monooxygenase SsuD/methylene tetrahydromethanopterin reductase-like flavin-dependent oxidoreductase (luciferase family)
MQIGFNAPTSGALIGPESLTRIVTEGEALGFDYVTIRDHIMVPRHLDSRNTPTPIPENFQLARKQRGWSS